MKFFRLPTDRGREAVIWNRTDSDGLYPDTLLHMGIGRVVRVLVVQDILAAEGIDKGSAT